MVFGDFPIKSCCMRVVRAQLACDLNEVPGVSLNAINFPFTASRRNI